MRVRLDSGGPWTYTTKQKQPYIVSLPVSLSRVYAQSMPLSGKRWFESTSGTSKQQTTARKTIALSRCCCCCLGRTHTSAAAVRSHSSLSDAPAFEIVTTLTRLVGLNIPRGFCCDIVRKRQPNVGRNRAQPGKASARPRGLGMGWERYIRAQVGKEVLVKT